MQKETKELQVLDVIESAGLEQDTTKSLKEKFLPFWEQAEKWRALAEGLNVTDESQTREMKMAREARLALRAIRVDADKTRKALKEDSIRYGRAVQGVYNVIEYLIKPIEDHLLKQEQFVEIQAQKRLEELNEERERIAGPLMEWINEDLPANNTPWVMFTDEKFAAIIAAAQQAKKAHEEEQARIEAERVAAEQARREEEARIRAENERLKKEAEERERKAAEERRKLEEQARKEREEAEKILAAERAERGRLEAEAKKREELERKAREAEEDARRKAEAAPDKEKLMAFVDKLSAITAPSVETDQAQGIANLANRRLSELACWIREQAEKM